MGRGKQTDPVALEFSDKQKAEIAICLNCTKPDCMPWACELNAKQLKNKEDYYERNAEYIKARELVKREAKGTKSKKSPEEQERLRKLYMQEYNKKHRNRNRGSTEQRSQWNREYYQQHREEILAKRRREREAKKADKLTQSATKEGENM